MESYPKPGSGQDRLLPHARDIEAVALGCILLQADNAQTADAVAMVGQLNVGLFFDVRHRTILDAFKCLCIDGKPLGTITVARWLTDKNKVEEAGGSEYLAGLAKDAVPAAFDSHLSTLKDKAQRRELLRLSAEAERLAHDESKDPAALASQFADAAAAILTNGTEPKTEILSKLDKAIYSAEKLGQIEVPTRESVIGDWFKQGDLGFIYGARGLGKTWLAMLIARRCGEGAAIAIWSVQKPRRVLYIDGEMPLDEVRKRDAALTTVKIDGVSYLHHEALFHSTGLVLNLTNPSAQEAILHLCRRDKIEVLILDNLSTLFAGIKENDADAWEKACATRPGG